MTTITEEVMPTNKIRQRRGKPSHARAERLARKPVHTPADHLDWLHEQREGELPIGTKDRTAEREARAAGYDDDSPEMKAAKKKGWREQWFSWPSERDAALTLIKWSVEADQCVYSTQTLFRSRSRTKGNALPTRRLSFELDSEPTPNLDSLDALELNSGSGDGIHVTTALSVYAKEDRADELAYTAALRCGATGGSDGGKWESNGYTRLVGTKNTKYEHRPEVTVRMQPQRAWYHEELESVLGGVDKPTRTATRTDPIDMEAMPPKRRMSDSLHFALECDEDRDNKSDHIYGAWKQFCKERYTKGQAKAGTQDHPGYKKYSEASIDAQIHKAYAEAESETARAIGRDVADIEEDDPDLTPWVGASELRDWKSNNCELVNISELLSKDLPPMKFLERELIVEGLVTKLTARSGAGKSINTGVMGFNWARGLSATDLEDDASPRRFDHPLRVLYLDGELGEQWWQRYLRLMGATGEDMSNFLLKCFPKWPSLTKDEGAKRFWHLFIATTPDVVIMDTLGAFTKGEKENEAETWARFDERITLPLKERGVTFIINDHAGYSEEARRGRGNSSKQSNIDVEWGISADEKDSNKLHLTREKDRTGMVPQKIELMRHDEPLRVERLVHTTVQQRGSVVDPDLSNAKEPRGSGRPKVSAADYDAMVRDFVQQNPNASRNQVAKGIKARKERVLAAYDRMIAVSDEAEEILDEDI